MRRLLSSRNPDPNANEVLLEVLQTFDDLVIAGTDLQRLAAATGEMLGTPVHVLDLLNDRLVSSDETEVAEAVAGTGRELLTIIGSASVATREVVRHEVGGRAVFAAPLEDARGVLGIAWTRHPDDGWDVGTELVLERFAQAASTVIQRDNRSQSASPTRDLSALERLIIGGLDAEGVKVALRASNLNDEARYSVLALAIDPPNVVSDAVATALVGRALDSRQTPWRAVTVMNAPLMVVPVEVAKEQILRDVVRSELDSGWRIHVGVGGAVDACDLSRSAAQARRALLFGGWEVQCGVTLFENLGALRLLGAIPDDAVQREPDVRAVAALSQARSGVNDLALLVAYCETGSMRKTGERLYLHHSSVEYRVRRIEADIGFSLSTPAGRFRALLAAMAFRMSSAGDPL